MTKSIGPSDLLESKKSVYDKCSFLIKNLVLDKESKAYQAVSFELNSLEIIFRSAKITPKKIGQFVTFWKRNKDGIIEPFHEEDIIDFYVINVRRDKQFGQFVIPKSVLIKKGIISTTGREGKRGFRVYPPWDLVISKQAKKTQKWQLDYFLEIQEDLNLDRAKKLYEQE